MCRLNVRCCCQPVKILGTLPWDERSPVWNFPLRSGGSLRLRVETMTQYVRVDLPRLHTTTIEDEITRLIDSRVTELAWKAEGAPLDQLRNVADFIEGDSI